MHAVQLPHYPISLLNFTCAFVPFALLLAGALLYAESTPDLVFYRTVYTIWATTVLVTPALCAFTLPSKSPRLRAIWLLFWSAAFIVYLVHAAYAVFGVYHGSFDEFLAGQGVLPAVVNVVLTLWWALDVLLAWTRMDTPWINKQRIGAHFFIGLTFFASTVIIKRGFINVLGLLMAASVVLCLLALVDSRHRVRAAG